MTLLKILVLISIATYVLSADPCELHTNCRDCIRDPNQCHWCSSSSGNFTLRCRSVQSNGFKECDAIENPVSSIQVNARKNREHSSSDGNIVQITPQEYNIKLRPGQTIDFDFSFKRADNYPVDLYFLVDVSLSMATVKDTITEASERIIQIMKKKTKNVFMGFGSFVDKNAIPYVNIVDEKMTYSFKNQLSLTDNVTLFRNAVANTPLGTNRDLPEGGLDALAQVIVCNDVTGWRNVSRKFVLFFTDAVSHSAGDGKLAGIYTPYDGKCYTKDNLYTKELDLDYPSIGIINKLAFEKEVTVIFIVDQKVLDAYEVFNDYILGSISLPYINNNNVVTFESNLKLNLETMLSNNYEKITTKLSPYIKMTQELKQYVNIKLDPDCNDENICPVNGTEVFKFKGNITLLKYFEEDFDIDISINGYTEKVTLSVDVIDNCPCAEKVEKDSKDCHYGGLKICGICECYSNRYGGMCMCTKNQNNGPISDSEATCRDADKKICSGRGKCVCGTCHCPKGVTGQYCQCDSDSCPNQCNGNGVCNCGVCECGPQWTGVQCDCSTLPCKGHMGKSCSGRGTCSCGKCACDRIASWDARTSQLEDICQVLPCEECHTKQCQLLQPCAYCQHDLKHCQVECDPGIQVHIDVNATGSGIFTCDHGRPTQFQYIYLSDVYGISLYVDSNKNRVENLIKLGLILLASLILVGLGTVVAWKVLTEFQDRREYTRFLKQQEADPSAANQNPIYEPATTTFINPAFRKKSVDYRL